ARGLSLTGNPRAWLVEGAFPRGGLPVNRSTLRPSRRALAGRSRALLAVVLIGCTPLVCAQQSVGRGWPVGEEAQWVGAGVPFYNIDAAIAKNGATPNGIEPLARDVFTSDDFYVDRELWRDPRYFRCNSTLGLDSQRGDYSSAPTYITDDPAK